MAAGADPKKVIFTGIAKSNEEIIQGIRKNILSFNIESESEMFRIEKLAKNENKIVDVAIRFNPEIDAGGHEYIKTGRKKLANRSVLINPKGNIHSYYDKIHMYDVILSKKESYFESRTFVAGKKYKISILACSALKESYRVLLNVNSNNIKWIFLTGSFTLIRDRLKKRNKHFMSNDLLKSQFEILEEPKEALKIEVSLLPNYIVKKIMNYIK